MPVIAVGGKHGNEMKSKRSNSDEANNRYNSNYGEDNMHNQHPRTRNLTVIIGISIYNPNAMEHGQWNITNLWEPKTPSGYHINIV